MARVFGKTSQSRERSGAHNSGPASCGWSAASGPRFTERRERGAKKRSEEGGEERLRRGRGGGGEGVGGGGSNAGAKGRKHR